MKCVFLTGSMGSGKSTLLKRASVTRTEGHITYCKEFDILGSQTGTDILGSYKKYNVLGSLKSFKGDKIVVAGEYYSKGVDIKRFEQLGFDVYCILLDVHRQTIKDRSLQRSGRWNEKTYDINLRNRINFFNKVSSLRRVIVKNNTLKDADIAWEMLLRI